MSIQQYTITGSAWTAITTAGQSGSCWLDAEDDGAKGQVDVRLFHSDAGEPAAAKVTEGYPVRRPVGNRDQVSITADNVSDIFYARCFSADAEAILTVDVV